MSIVKIKMVQKRNSTRQDFSSVKLAEAEQNELKEKALIAKANKIENYLVYVSSRLELLDNENFDSLFPVLLNNMKEATTLREELIEEVGSEELLKNRPELFLIPKQIEKKYDNIVKLFSAEDKRLERELASLYQRKKLTAYQR